MLIAEIVDQLIGFFHASLNAVGNIAVIGAGFNRVRWEGINRVGAKLIDIHNVAVAGVLGAGAGPQQSLDIGTFC